MKAALVAGALIVASLSGAQASEPYSGAKGDSVANWSGPYIGAHLGYAWQRSSNTWRSPGAGYFTPQPDGDIDDSGVAGGGFAGYQKQIGNFVIGAEADFSFASLKGNDSQFAGQVNSLEIGNFGSVRARFGWASGNSLLFVTGGYAFAQFTKGDETSSAWAKHYVGGWTIGGGYEARLSRGWRARVEYQYLNFGETESYLDFGGGLYYLHSADDLSIHVLRTGLSYAF